jgi:hypothetical protein
VARAVADGEADGDGLGAPDPTVGEGWALRLGLGLGDAAPGERLDLGRLVRVGAGLLWRACGWSCRAGLGVGDAVAAGASTPPGLSAAGTGRTST